MLSNRTDFSETKSGLSSLPPARLHPPASCVGHEIELGSEDTLQKEIDHAYSSLALSDRTEAGPPSAS